MASIPNLEILVGHPSGGELVRAYLSGDESVERFFGPSFGAFATFEAKAREVDARFDRDARESAAAAVIVPPGGDAARLERFVEEGGYMVTTGQQAALFGGPLYNLFKALTAARLAEALEERFGKPVLPLFWVSSEDHDWDEACHSELVGVDNELHRVELAHPSPDVTPAIHRITLGADIDAALTAFLALLPETDFSAEYRELLQSSFRADGTLADGFHGVLQPLLGSYGIFFTDAIHPVVKRDSAGVILAELERGEELEDVLRGTASALEERGYALQVPIMEGGVNLFAEGPAGRERIYRENGGFRLRTSGEELSMDEVRARFASDPNALSPNVLLRPVVESALFPTLAYVGGPGEMAYFGQLRDYFEAHGVTMPIVYPRWSATPVEGKIGKVLQKFGMEVGALDRPFHEIASEVAREEVPADVRAAVGKMRGAVGSGFAELTKAARGVDETLNSPMQQGGKQVLGVLDDLEKKVVQAVKRQSEVALSQLEKAQVHLFPGGKPAERVQSPFYYLARYGGAVLESFYERFRVNLE
ncbi:MAG: bacillithiol biosynthesis cysteine-adding enzyme BshC [Gemmatimonadota bacterium]|nr:bacillithiol biosynthesis cysteine-adding enzyme BshC [Gemmatimonadota bacterium]MDH3422284.1 bacillithiol biosynthesis cysteine-adding enzyme BshC [Gemmatimonadota bacterium]